MKVNVISESAFTVQGHGVHTAFTETIDCLRHYTDCDVASNTDRPADVVHIHTVGPYSLRKLLSRRSSVKIVSAHVTPDSFVGSLVGAKYWYGLAQGYLRWFYNRADGVLAVSQEVVDELHRFGVTKPIFLVPNTIETQPFRTTAERRDLARRRLELSDGEFVVVGNGQVQPRKRLDVFVEVARKLPKIRFIWVGGMPFKQLAADGAGMERLVKSAPSNVTFTGLVDRGRIPEYFHAADLFFLPSAQETFGIVIVEAAAAGLPILLRDLAQYRDTFGDGYERGEDADFAAQIGRFSRDRTYYEHWQKAARGIAKRYDARAGAARLMEVYHELLNHKAHTKKSPE